MEDHEGISILALPPFGSDAQKAFILKQGADGVPVAEICRRAGISQADLLQLEEEVRRLAADGDEADLPPSGPAVIMGVRRLHG